jgi:DNA-binding response OmpR family regulator
MEKRPKILSIDDNQDSQKLVELILAGDYEVRTALSGSSGIEALVSFEPDAILLDVDMPTLDGLRLCRMIRAEPSFASTPILFVSGLNSPEDQARGFQAGGDDYISKPIDLSQLRQKLSFSLERAALLDEQASASNDSLALGQKLQALHDFLVTLISFSDSLLTLGELTLHALDKLGLKGAIYLHPTEETCSSIGPLTDLETLLLQQATRPYPSEYSARYLWGSEYFGAIIQNMPFARHDQYQPLVQILTTLFNAVSQKIPTLGRNARAQLYSAAPKLTHKPDLAQVQIHGYHLESAVEELEQNAERTLGRLCQRLQELAQTLRSSEEIKQLRNMLDDAMKARLAIYDHCLEIQSQYSGIMAQLGIKAAQGT